VLAFSTNPRVRRRSAEGEATLAELGNEAMSPLFQAVVEATEEALYNALFMATPVSTRTQRVAPLPADSVARLLRGRGIGAPR
jgi:D-aminopeptidase